MSKALRTKNVKKSLEKEISEPESKSSDLKNHFQNSIKPVIYLLLPVEQLTPNSKGLLRLSSEKYSQRRLKYLENMETDPPYRPDNKDRFNKPKKTIKLKQHFIDKKTNNTLKINNKYKVLTDKSDRDDDIDIETETRRIKRFKPNSPRKLFQILTLCKQSEETRREEIQTRDQEILSGTSTQGKRLGQADTPNRW